MDQGQFMVLSGRQLRGLHQYTLDIFVVLFGKWCPQDLVCGTLFFSAQPAVANSLFDRPEARYIPDLERPGKCGDVRLREVF
jgi:hypothetical protein